MTQNVSGYVLVSEDEIQFAELHTEVKAIEAASRLAEKQPGKRIAVCKHIKTVTVKFPIYFLVTEP